ncbi:MAG: hypothetical protein K6A79_06360 [Ruminococcus sp.]|nr:hypothetical protein [Ruminococcus sp.]
METNRIKRKISSLALATAISVTAAAPTLLNINSTLSGCTITASAASITMSDAEYQKGLHIYEYLHSHTTWNDGAICGLLAHLYAESRFNPTAKNNSSGAYGIAQWRDSRKTNLMNKGNYSNVDVQLDFLISELSNTYYAASKNAINNASNDANGAYNVAYTYRLNAGWGVYNVSSASGSKVEDCKARGNEARDFFYPKYSKKSGTSFTILRGDLDLNGKVDTTDCTYLSLYLIGDTTLARIAGNEAATKANADVNGDGTINLVDLTTLKQMISKTNAPTNTSPKDVNYIERISGGTTLYKTPGGSICGSVQATGSYTIVKEQYNNGIKYGCLKSGAGWVIL